MSDIKSNKKRMLNCFSWLPRNPIEQAAFYKSLWRDPKAMFPIPSLAICRSRAAVAVELIWRSSSKCHVAPVTGASPQAGGGSGRRQDTRACEIITFSYDFRRSKQYKIANPAAFRVICPDMVWFGVLVCTVTALLILLYCYCDCYCYCYCSCSC